MYYSLRNIVFNFENLYTDPIYRKASLLTIHREEIKSFIRIEICGKCQVDLLTTCIITCAYIIVCFLVDNLLYNFVWLSVCLRREKVGLKMNHIFFSEYSNKCISIDNYLVLVVDTLLVCQQIAFALLQGLSCVFTSDRIQNLGRH